LPICRERSYAADSRFVLDALERIRGNIGRTDYRDLIVAAE